MSEEIYNMNLHESIEVLCDGTWIVKVFRVAGGWIYIFLDRNYIPSQTHFVSFDNEFMTPYETP